MSRRSARRRGTTLFTAALALLGLATAACGDDGDDVDGAAVSTSQLSTSDTLAPAAPDAAAPTDAPDETVGSTGAAPSEPTAATDSADRGTRTVQHELGTSEVPSDPQRIVVVDRRGSLAFLLELGFEPVGALDATWLFGEPFHPLVSARAEAAGVEPIDDTDGPNLEQIAALEPDVIIGNVRDMGETADELAELAPTIGLAWNFADPLANAVTIGEALGRPDVAHDLVEQFDAGLDAAAAEGVTPGTVSIIGLFAIDDLRIYRQHNLYGALTERLGGQIVPTEAELPLDPDDNEVNAVSMEQIGLATGERVISFVNLAAEADSAYRALESEALVQALPGFQAGQVLEADPQLAFGAAGVTGIQAMLDQLVEFYAG